MTTTSAVRGEEETDLDGPRPSPRDNFFLHVNWDWLHQQSIPPSESSWGVFETLFDRTLERLRDICAEAQSRTDAVKGSNNRIAGDFYASGMDMETRNREGLQPIAPLLSEIRQISTSADLARALAALHLRNIAPFFAISVEEDWKEPGRNALYISQSGLGMPDREYYLDNAKRETRDRYAELVTNIVRLSGVDGDETDEMSRAVMQVEMALAEASAPQEVVRQVDKNYHRFGIDRAKETMPGLDWDAYVERLGVPSIRSLVIQQPDFLRRVASMLSELSLDDIKRYLTLTVLRSCANMLGRDFVTEHFNFYGRTLAGMEEPRPLWKDVILRMQYSVLNNALGPLYAEQYFSAEDKARIAAIVAQIKAAFAERVGHLSWMSERTKELTLKKLENITFKMGYPDRWIDVSTLEMGPVYATNMLSVAEFDKRRKLGQLDKPVDRSEWIMAPITVNACADYKREMTFPMAILQPPFYDASREEIYNYGAIGYVIGHELTHFFDDQGSKFDVDGKLNTWWTSEDETAFKAASEKFVSHYEKYAVDGIPVNGRLTLGENISDVGGVVIAFDALQHYLKTHDSAGSDGRQTPEQKFFTGMAALWAEKVRHEERVRRATIDPHSQGQVRVNATLSATPPFYDAFAVTEEDGMYTPPEERPQLW